MFSYSADILKHSDTKSCPIKTKLTIFAICDMLEEIILDLH